VTAETAAAAGAALDRLAPEGVLGIAVSGGGDSVALLMLADRWARARGRRIEAATVDHGLRPESAAEAGAVAALCARLGISHQTLQAGDLRAGGGNLPAAARAARMVLLGDWARARGLAAVALGHTLDDQAETVLMRLARGSGAEGLSGMAPTREIGGTQWLRPLLGLRREALRAFLAAGGIGWADDPTNEQPEYDRVKARRALSALVPLGIDAEGLARTAWHLRRQRRVLERAMLLLAGHARCWGRFGEAWLDPAALAADELDTSLRLLADTLVRVGGSAYRPRFRALSGLLDQALSGRDFAATLAGCTIRREAGGPVLICREAAACQGPVPLAADGAVWDGRWRVVASGARPADAAVAMLGDAGLAELRRLAEAGGFVPPADWRAAPRRLRRTVPAVWAGAVLLAVPLAGHVNRSACGPEFAVAAENIAAGELRADQPPTYGPAGSLDPPP
jgi:tRNA(Ile)-lysidine synthase